MAVKLSKVATVLNVGVSTLAEFLQKKGADVKDNPNTRISDTEQLPMLVEEFAKTFSPQERAALIAQIVPPPVVQQPPQEEVVPDTPAPPPPPPVVLPEVEEVEIKAIIPEESRPRITIVGHTDNIATDDRRKKKKPKSAPAEKVALSEKSTPAEKPASRRSTPVREKSKESPKEVVEVVPIVADPIVTDLVETVPVPVDPVVPVVPVEEHIEPEKIIPVQPVEEEKILQPETVVEEAVADPVVPVTPPPVDADVPFRLERKSDIEFKVVDKINLDVIPQQNRSKRRGMKDEHPPLSASKPAVAAPAADEAKKKRKRIKKDRVDINNTPGTNVRPTLAQQRPHDNAPRRSGGSKVKKPVKQDLTSEDIQRQVKETLAQLTAKGKSKASKHRRDKREAAAIRDTGRQAQEARESRVLKLTEFVTANDLANMMDVPVTQVIGTCMSIGIMVSINQRLDAETINIVADEFGFRTEYVSAEVVEAIKSDNEDDSPEDYVTRPPVVAVMGHVDHGKTSLLDNIRKANVIAGEAGGITQHIGAYNVTLPNGRQITFLDTPGHEAFTAMRARGAKATDIAIIIVAADDNVMPQTIEAINHASAAGVPIVFAINKIDKPGANPEKIKEELANMNYLLEEWGGKYQSQDISAKKGIGIEELLEKVLLEADMLELKANPQRRAVGTVIESTLDKGRGYVATVLVGNGTLKMGDIVLAGTHYGRIKAMFNERNQRVESAAPSEPVLILGLNGAPQAGDTFNVLETEQEAREIAVRREQLQRELGLRTQKMLTLDDIGRRIAIGRFQELNVIVKGDVDGSVEALSDSLIRLSTEEIQVNVIHKAVGQISESDVTLAATSNAIIIGFQVRPAQSARRSAEKEGVEIRLYSVIYDAIEEVRAAMEGMLSPEIKEEITANVDVSQVFKITKVGVVAGCIVKEGKLKRTNKIRLIRDGIVIHTGVLGSLKRFKDDVREVSTGQDCGLNIQNFNDIQVGDIIEAYEETEVKKTL
ncbi:MAG: translation initiation factor IF-2 [Tannerellaceae bacterium]|jgi:translation initiation factor IF-2|nr:translation initiation factor IF-2 [Tannerellaceae bacterium]